MNKVVKYHNKLNELRFPNFKEQELNIFCHLLYQLRDKEQEKLKFTASEVATFFGSAYDNKTLAWMLKHMLTAMKARGFEYVEREGTSLKRHYITMFPTFTITTDPNPNAIDEMDAEILKSLEVRINPDFAYLLNKLKGNFTRFELAEFVSISSKYTKRLYMNLKQFRSTGILTMEWNEFKRIMDIPGSYQMRDIEKQILKPAIKELSQELNLFDSSRIPFKNLKYKKTRGKGRGRGGNVVGIEFTFEPQKADENNGVWEQKAQFEADQEQFMRENFVDCAIAFCDENGIMRDYRITDIQQDNNVIRVHYKDSDSGRESSKSFDGFTEFRKWFDEVKLG